MNSQGDPRLQTRFPIRVTERTGSRWTADASNLSPFGLKIRDIRITPPAFVQLDFEVPGTMPGFSVMAVAVRSDPDGTTFAFTNLEANDNLARNDFVRLRDAVGTILLRRKLWAMIVGDDRQLAETLADAAAEHGYDTIIMPNPGEALAFLVHDQPDAIVLGLTSPSTSPSAFLETLANRRVHIPVVVLHSRASEPDERSYLERGAVHVAGTPLDLEQFSLILNVLEVTTHKSLLRRLDREFDFTFRP